MVAFPDESELEERITQSYLQMRNLVLLYAAVAFKPLLVSTTHPDPLANLCRGARTCSEASWV